MMSSKPDFNYRIDEMRSALGLIQLEKLEKANIDRKVLVERYIELLDKVKGLSIPFLHHSEIVTIDTLKSLAASFLVIYSSGCFGCKFSVIFFSSILTSEMILSLNSFGEIPINCVVV